MKCSICEKDACYLKYNYKNDKSIEYVEGRCEEHLRLDYRNQRRERKEKLQLRKGKVRKKQAVKKDIKVEDKKKGFWSWLSS